MNFEQYLILIGIAEDKKSGIVITAGTDGGIVFWNSSSNSTMTKKPFIGGKEVKLSGLIMTENNLLVASMRKKNDNLAFLPFDMRKVFDFVLFDGGHEENITSVKSVKQIPMFLSISKSKVIRWWSGTPPKVLSTYTQNNINDADCGFII